MASGDLKPIISQLLSEASDECELELTTAVHRCRFYNAVNVNGGGGDVVKLAEQLKNICPTAPAVYLFQQQSESCSSTSETAFGNVASLSPLRFHLDNILAIVPNETVVNVAVEEEKEETQLPLQLPFSSFIPWQASEIVIYDENVANFYTTNVQLELDECQRIHRESVDRYAVATDRYKRIRLSSSHFLEVSRRRAEVNKEYLDKLFNQRDASMTTTSTSSSSSALLNFQQVIELYKKEMDKLERGIRVENGGLVINPTCPYLAASADGQVVDSSLDEPNGLLKIIFPPKYRNVNLFEAATKPDFCSPVGQDGKMALKKNHSYFSQIQGLIALSGLNWCDLVICTKGGVCIERIEKEDGHFQNMFGKLTEFYFTKCLPYLADKFGNIVV